MPTTWTEIQRICTFCHGTGKVVPPSNQGTPPPLEIDCPICLGEGYIEWGREKV